MTSGNQALIDCESRGLGRWLSVPAWLLSLVFHLAVFLVVAIVIRPAASLPSHEPDRAASIVVARSTEHQSVTYLQEGPPTTIGQVVANVQTATDIMPPNDTAAAPLLAGIELPKAVSLAGAQGDISSAALLGHGRGTRATFAGSDDEALIAEEAKAAPAGPQAKLVEVSVFGSAPAAGRSFVFLLDHSKSMGTGGLDVLGAAEREISAALSRLAPEHHFQIIAYNERPTFLGRRQLLAGTDENKRAVQRYFAELIAVGATEHEAALHAALRLRPDVVFLLTDGGDPQLSDGQLREVRQHSAGRTTIHGIQFGFGPLQERDSFLQRLARENGGEFRYVDVSTK